MSCGKESYSYLEKILKIILQTHVQVTGVGGYDLSDYLDDKYRGFLHIDDDNYVLIMIVSDDVIGEEEKASLRNDWILDGDVEMDRKIKSIIIDLDIPLNLDDPELERFEYLKSIKYVDDSNKIFSFPRFPNYIFFSYAVKQITDN